MVPTLHPTDALLVALSATDMSSEAMETTSLTNLVTTMKADEQDKNDTLNELDLEALKQSGLDSLA